MSQQSPMASFAFPNEQMSVGFGVEQGQYPAETVRLTYIDSAVNAVLRAGEGVRRQNIATHQSHASLVEERERMAQVHANNNHQRANLRAIISPQPTPVTAQEKLDMIQAHAGNTLDLHNQQFDETRANQAYVEAVQGGMLDDMVPASLAEEPMFYEDLFRVTESIRPNVIAAPIVAAQTESVSPIPESSEANTPELTEQSRRLAEIRAGIDTLFNPAEHGYAQVPQQSYENPGSYTLGA